MIARNTIRRLSVAAAPWTAWAARLQLRHRRWADRPGRPLRFRLPGGRAALLMSQQRLALHVNVQLQLTLRPGIVAAGYATATRQILLPPRQDLARPGSEGRDRQAGQGVAPGERTRAFARTLQLRHAATGPSSRPSAANTAARPSQLPPSGDPTSRISRRAQLRWHSETIEISDMLVARARRVVRSSSAGPRMALRRDVGAATGASASSATPPDFGWSEPLAARRVSPPTPPPVVNVEQLAKQVLMQIDRQVIARRERMGVV
jgi:hypothetical protein